MYNSFKQLYIIIPVFNAEKHIEKSVHQITNYLSQQNIRHKFILVNDNSTDSTANKLILLSNQYENIQIVTNQKNIGQDNSTLTGLRLVKNAASFVIDDDFEYEPASISALIKLLAEKNADLVYGIPINNKTHYLRKNAHLLSHFLLKVFGYKNASNFKLLSEELVSKTAQIRGSKYFSIDKFLVTTATKIEYLKINNIPNNHSRYNFCKLVSKFLNFILYSK